MFHKKNIYIIIINQLNVCKKIPKLIHKISPGDLVVQRKFKKKKMLLDVFAAIPPNLVEKEQEKHKLQIFIDNHLIK